MNSKFVDFVTEVIAQFFGEDNDVFLYAINNVINRKTQLFRQPRPVVVRVVLKYLLVLILYNVLACSKKCPRQLIFAVEKKSLSDLNM